VPVWVQLYTSVDFFKSLKSPGMEPLVVLTSRPIVAMMITLGYEMNYNVDQFNYVTYQYLLTFVSANIILRISQAHRTPL